MRRLSLGVMLVTLLVVAAPAAAHQVPFSYVDARVGADAVDVTLVVHMVDVAHELGIDPPERLLDPAFLASRADAITSLLEPRLRLTSDGRALTNPTWFALEPLAERQSVRMQARFTAGRRTGMLAIDARMFPYDPPHQTFVNFYDEGELRFQAILDQTKTHVEYFSGSRQGTFAVVRRFIPAGIHHILIGPDHLLFLIGLLLLGGSIRQLALVVSAFTLAHSITLTLAALNYVSPPARIVEPAIALSIVYVGADNLMVRDGRDVRGWIAFAFGFIHGFGFANVLGEMDLPRRALGWSLFSFNLGVELGQLLVVVTVASALAALRSRNEAAGRRLAVAGSLVVIAAGAFWFIQRVFFPGGMA
jgi:hydrogenase/urease accessory protein HupE